MKYILIPIFKLIWAIILTLIWICFQIPFMILCLIWNFNFSFKYKTVFGDSYVPNFDHTSPYYQVNPNITGYYTKEFKSYFHYIWNLK